MILNVETQEKCKKCFHFQVCSSVLKNDLFIREVMLKEKEPKCKSFVEVVPCGECRYFRLGACYRLPDMVDEQTRHISYDFCNNAPAYHGFNKTDFCSYGERR